MLKYDYKYAVVFADDQRRPHVSLQQRKQETLALARAVERMGAVAVHAFNVEREDTVFESGDIGILPR